jgi:hypothetical protein
MEKMAKQQGQALDSLAPNQWEQLWQAAKKEQG